MRQSNAWRSDGGLGTVGVLMVGLWAMPGWARKPKPLSACRTTTLSQLIDYALAIGEAQGRMR